MPMYAFDTLQTAKTLAEAGFDAKQAEAVAGALRDAVTENTATKADIDGIGRRFENVGERFDGVDRRFENVDKRFDGVDQRLDRMDDRFDGIDRRLDKMDDRFDGMDRRLDKMDKRLDKMDARLDVMDARLEGMVTKADMYRMLLMQFGAIILANGTITAVVLALAEAISGGP